jgi:hypothetical protein
MRRRWPIIFTPVAISIVAAVSFYLFYQSHLQSQAEQSARHISCLSAVIPSVVLHHQQGEIVALLQELASDTGTPIAQEDSKPSAFFSSAIDSELIRISELYQAKQKLGASNTSEVNQAVDRAVKLMRSEKLGYFEECDRLMKTIESECGSLKQLVPDNPSCFQKYNQQLSDLKAMAPNSMQ